MYTIEDQIKAELVMRETGASNFLNNQERLRNKGQGCQTLGSMQLIKHYTIPISEALVTFCDTVFRGKPGINAKAAAKLKEITVTKRGVTTVDYDRIIISTLLAVCDLVLATEKVSKAVLVSKIGKAIEDESRWNFLENNSKNWLEFKLKDYKENNSSYSHQRTGTIHIMNTRKAGGDENFNHISWTQLEKSEVGLLMLSLITANTNMINISTSYNNKKMLTYIDLSDEVHEWLLAFNKEVAVKTNTYHAMFIKPRPWTEFEKGGYYSIDLPFVKNNTYLDKTSINLKTHMQDLNDVQDTPWCIDVEMLDILKVLSKASSDLVNSKGQPLLNTSEDIPRPNRPTILEGDCDMQDGLVQDTLAQFKKDVRETIQLNNKRRSKYISQHEALRLATVYSGWDEVYFPQQADSRGRAYPIPSTLHPQACDSIRSLLWMAEEYELSDDGLWWLGVKIAGLFGHDDVSLDDRVQWVINSLETLIRPVATNPLDNKELWVDADKPFQFIQACREYINCIEAWNAGLPYKTRLTGQVDGKCNGLQHYTLITRDLDTAKEVGLVPTNVPGDIYSRVAENTINLLRAIEKPTYDTATVERILSTHRAEITPEDKLISQEIREYNSAQSWLKYGVARKIAKRPTMTCVYGSGRFGYANQIREELRSMSVEMRPEGDLFELSTFLAKYIDRALKVSIGGASEAMAFLQKCASVYTTYYNKMEHCNGLSWLTPNGFLVNQQYRKKDYKEISLRLNTTRYKLKLPNAAKKLNVVKMSNSICPNFVHSIDAAHLTLTVRMAKERGLRSFSMIHDDYGTRLNDMDILVSCIKEAAIEIHSRDLLQEFLDNLMLNLPENIIKYLPKLPPKGDLNIEDLRESEFFFS